MAVIINELEVIVEQSQQTRSGGGGSVESASQPQQLKPLDLKEIAERNEYLRLRTFAH